MREFFRPGPYDENCAEECGDSFKRLERHSHLWLFLPFFVFMVMLAAGALIMAFFSLVINHSPELIDSARPQTPLLAMLIISIIIGTIISLTAGKKLVAPLANLSIATQRVAKGDFSVRIDEFHRMAEMRHLARNFNNMVQELNSIETLRNDFVANVSHEFKTPLSAIEGYASLLRDKELTEEERDEYTRMILEAASQLSGLSGNLLRISRLESQGFVAEKSRFMLDEQIREALLLLENQWSKKNIQLHIDMESIDYYGSAELLTQVWINLLHNAIKFTPEGGSIYIQLTREANYVRAVVKDTGCGIRQKDMPHIFEKFYRADNSRSGDGNGLGLPLVKRIIDLCGGTIMVESSPVAGASFIVLLPLSAEV